MTAMNKKKNLLLTAALVLVQSLSCSAFVTAPPLTCPTLTTTQLDMYADNWMTGSSGSRQTYAYNGYDRHPSPNRGGGMIRQDRPFYDDRLQGGGRYPSPTYSNNDYGGDRSYHRRSSYDRHDYENSSMDYKQQDLWRHQRANENFIENPYGTSRYHGGQHYRQTVGSFDEYDRQNLYHDVTRPQRRPRGMARQEQIMRQKYDRDAFIERPYGNRRGPW
ncbi:expressed unknown protein [Seminavis robusta]|uniref:Uncharacterized protein n=1 Tax=Seminavis robusta TaxID=568900 RepID=A0A9N8ERG6_9STRA|nr:expressed unknown protein [Seminavis robusta]|eukprot:Sro1480_g276190.1 n/a (219) ;mRNA; r:18849-19505